MSPFILWKRKYPSVLCLMTLLYGCVGTDGIAPQGQMVNGYSIASGEDIARAVKEASWPEGEWWRSYGDEQLNRWVQIATGSSPSLVMAAARLREARALAGLARSGESFQINGEASLDRKNWPDDPFYGPGALSGAQTWNNSASLAMKYPFDLWDRDKNSTLRYLDLAHAAAAQERMAQLELQGGLVRTYIELSLHYAERDVLEQTLGQQEQIQQLAFQRLQGGIGTHFELTQTQAPIADTHREIDVLNERIALDRNQIAALAGLGPDAGATLARPSLSLKKPIEVPSAIPAALVGRRPDITASRWSVAAQARGVDVAHANFYPNIDLVGSLGYIASGGDVLSFLSSNKRNYSVGPAISLPIFDGGRLRSELGEASAQYDIAVAGYNQTLIHAVREVSDQVIRGNAVARQQAFVDQAMVSAQRSFDIAITAYQRGLTDYLQVLNAQTQLLHERKTLQRTQAAGLTAHAGLMVALGGGGLKEVDAPSEDQMRPSEQPAILKKIDNLMSRQ